MTSTTVAQPLAYRCSNCFQLRCSNVDCVGQQVTCEFCGTENTVPEATPERVAQGEEFASDVTLVADHAANHSPDWEFTADHMSDEEIMLHCRQQTIAKVGVGGLVCSRLQRFAGAVIDGIAMFAAFVGGAIVGVLIYPPQQGQDPNPATVGILFGIPLTLALVQMVLTATEGRTIGKYCVNAKIVDAKGQPPGFIRGVLLRQFVNCLLALIPFYGLIDVLAIFFNDEKRCIHDWLAGTHVINAN